MKSSDQDEIAKFREKYRQIGSVKCPALSNELVYFGRSGFNHLIRKGRKLRKSEEQIDRLEMLIFAPYILAMSKTFENFRVVEDKVNPKNLVKFWSISRYVSKDKHLVTVIVRQSGNGKKEFYSIFA